MIFFAKSKKWGDKIESEENWWFLFLNKKIYKRFLIYFSLKIFFNFFGPFNLKIICFSLKIYFIHISLHDFEKDGRQKLIKER